MRTGSRIDPLILGALLEQLPLILASMDSPLFVDYGRSLLARNHVGTRSLQVHISLATRRLCVLPYS